LQGLFSPADDADLLDVLVLGQIPGHGIPDLTRTAEYQDLHEKDSFERTLSEGDCTFSAVKMSKANQQAGAEKGTSEGRVWLTPDPKVEGSNPLRHATFS
jgi:hypothetical protein